MSDMQEICDMRESNRAGDKPSSDDVIDELLREQLGDIHLHSPPPGVGEDAENIIDHSEKVSDGVTDGYSGSDKVTGSGSDKVTGSGSDKVTGSGSDKVTGSGSDGERQADSGSDGKRQADSGSDGERQADSGSEGEEQTSSGNVDEPENKGKPHDRFTVDDVHLAELEKDMTPEQLQERYSESCELKQAGNEEFRAQQHEAALHTYTKALHLCPQSHARDRAILYSNRAAARTKLDQIEEAISDCSKAIELDPCYIKALMRRAKLYEESDKLDEALDDYKAVVERDGGMHEARAACMRLPEQINERNERLKTEMLGKLKDLGNMVLRPFGLSTDNFQVNQDPDSGSYSVNFQQRPPKNGK